MTWETTKDSFRINFPETGTTTYTYDTYGRLKEQTDALGRKRTWEFEGGRLKRGSGAEYTYDGYGRLYTVSHGGGIETYGWTPAGQMELKRLNHG